MRNPNPSSPAESSRTTKTPRSRLALQAEQRAGQELGDGYGLASGGGFIGDAGLT